MLTRRKMLAGTAAAAGAWAASGQATRAATTTAVGTGSSLGERAFLAKLGETLAEEFDYEARVEGRLPDGLAGVLYRNGPGRFDRGGVRKRHLLDGDGMVQRFEIGGGRVRYRNRYVRTPKLIEEEAKGRLVKPTWTTRAPGGIFANLGGGIESQAGVTVYQFDGHVLALDEIGPPYEVNAATLATEGPFPVGPDGGARVADGGIAIKAHTKFDAANGDWLVLGGSFGRTMTLHTIVHGRDGALKSHAAWQAPRQVYFHDFAATERYIVALLQPLDFSPLRFLAGLSSFTDSLTWRPKEAGVVMVMDRAGKAEPVLIDAPPVFAWHFLNAYERGGEIVLDFVGYTEPDHFIGDNPAFAAIMRGEAGVADAKGLFRRFTIDPAKRALRHETLVDGNFEFPYVAPASACRPHRFGYVTEGRPGTLFHQGVARIDTDSGRVERFDFGPMVHVGEAVFAPRGSAGGAGEPGWLLALCLDGRSGTSFLAILDAEHVADGPVARVWLRHHTPLSFHGSWVSADV